MEGTALVFRDPIAGLEVQLTVELASWMTVVLVLSHIFFSTLAQAFAANCICKTPSISTRWGLYTVHKPSSSRDSNPGLLGVKRQHYLYAIRTPTRNTPVNLSNSPELCRIIFVLGYRCKDSKQLFFSSRTLPKLFI